MKRDFRRLLLTLVFIFCANQLWAESSVWEVNSPTSTVYLVGSCHVLRASDHPLPPEFDIAYQNSQRIVLEAPLAEMEKPPYLARLMSAAIYHDGATIRQRISPGAYARVEEFCKKRNYPLDQYQLFRPWMLAMTLTMQELARIGASAVHGVDHYFHKKALADGKKIGSLETVDQQIGFLSVMDRNIGEEQLISSIADLEQIENKGPEILEAWKKGDEARLAELNLKQRTNFPRLYQALFVERNQKWISEIESYLKGQENVMIIVGVAHLAGADSVVDLLERRGHKVTKLKKVKKHPQYIPIATPPAIVPPNSRHCWRISSVIFPLAMTGEKTFFIL